MNALGTRTIAQIVFVVIGIAIWGYGQRIEDDRLTLVSIGFFATAMILRFIRRGDRDPG